VVSPSGFRQHLREPLANSTALVGEPGEGNPESTHFQGERLGPAEDLQIGVGGEPFVRDPRPLMITRHYEDGHPCLRDLDEGPKRLECQGRGHARPVEYVPSMDDEVHLTGASRREGQPMVGQEIVTPPPAFNPGSGRQVESQVGIGQEEHSDCCR
jgi:hypothetical protein